MKKILVIMMAIMMYVTSFAQTTEHMKFKGVPMEGTLQTFTNKLKAKGFTPFGVQDDETPEIRRTAISNFNNGNAF